MEADAQRAATRPPRIGSTIRVDAIQDRDPAIQLGLGLSVPSAFNVRLSLDAGAGPVWRDGQTLGSGRVDLLARVLTDPFRQSRWALNAGGGLGQRLERGARPRTVAILTVGLDGPSRSAWIPGIEVGLGGGIRVGATLRRAPRTRR